MSKKGLPAKRSSPSVKEARVLLEAARIYLTYVPFESENGQGNQTVGCLIELAHKHSPARASVDGLYRLLVNCALSDEVPVDSSDMIRTLELLGRAA